MFKRYQRVQFVKPGDEVELVVFEPAGRKIQRLPISQQPINHLDENETRKILEAEVAQHGFIVFPGSYAPFVLGTREDLQIN